MLEPAKIESRCANERFVIPVSAEQRRSVQGGVHGDSGTDKRFSWKPFEVERTTRSSARRGTRSGNCTNTARATEKLPSDSRALLVGRGKIAELDSTFAASAVREGIRRGGSRSFRRERMRLVDARHPVLEDKLRKGESRHRSGCSFSRRPMSACWCQRRNLLENGGAEKLREWRRWPRSPAFRWRRSAHCCLC